jgi:hypothetical protein
MIPVNVPVQSDSEAAVPSADGLVVQQQQQLCALIKLLSSHVPQIKRNAIHTLQ